LNVARQNEIKHEEISDPFFNLPIPTPTHNISVDHLTPYPHGVQDGRGLVALPSVINTIGTPLDVLDMENYQNMFADSWCHVCLCLRSQLCVALDIWILT
jgi:hypothetical protein